MSAGPAALSQLLEESTRRRPEQMAIEDPERDELSTYDNLNTRSDKIRDALIRGGVRTGDRVGLCAPKSIATVASIFGVLKAGAAYVPVDCTAPPQRNAFIFQDCGVRVIVAEDCLVEGLRAATEGYPLSTLEMLDSDLRLLQGPGHRGDSSGSTPADLAYILYTSGSTGQPKGVMHEQGSALGFIDWCSEVLAPTEEDRFSSHAPFHFDLSILDVYVPIKHGATLILIGEELGKQPVRLAPVISERKISVWYSAPSILRLLVELGRLDRYEFSALRLVLFAGEVFPTKYLRALKAHWPAPRYLNLYGPTETNVCTYYEVPQLFADDRTEPFPIGKACSNDRCMVVDEQGREVKRGEEGELFVAGSSVMLGYWNRPERTAEAFYTDAEGTAWYRTGDIVREDPDGDYIFRGRRDRMVKRRGYRVELGEIESALYRHPDVREAAVIALPDADGGVAIHAILSCKDERRPTLVEWKRFCSEQLPLYMIPDRFTVQPSLPKTSTDKVDYQKLCELQRAAGVNKPA
jgi:L-proline---[L-prolyl-carrier protein] ligase